MKKFVKMFLYFCLIVVSLLFSVKAYLSLNYKNEILKDTDKLYSYAIVPGARIYENKPSLFLKERLDKAIYLYKKKVVKKIILSGGYNKTYYKYESDVMLSYLESKGITEDVIIDNGGVSTYDTIYRYHKKFPNKKAILITQEIYAYRSLYIARNLNTLIDVMDCSTGKYKVSMKAYIRELLAPIKAIWDVNTKKVSQYSLVEKDFS